MLIVVCYVFVDFHLFNFVTFQLIITVGNKRKKV